MCVASELLGKLLVFHAVAEFIMLINADKRECCNRYFRAYFER